VKTGLSFLSSTAGPTRRIGGKHGACVSTRADAASFARSDDARMASLAQPRQVVPLDEATVADAMSAGVIHCAPETPLRTVARLMATYGVHAVYVFDYSQEDDESVQLWGLVSDLDLVAACPVLDERTARSSAVTPLVTVSLLEPLTRAAALMAAKGTAHLAVLDPATRRPVGVLSTLDIARFIAADQGAGEVPASS
jgi:CBS domain-containing protein